MMMMMMMTTYYLSIVTHTPYSFDQSLQEQSHCFHMPEDTVPIITCSVAECGPPELLFRSPEPPISLT